MEEKRTIDFDRLNFGIEQWRACAQHSKGSWVMKTRIQRLRLRQKSQEG